MPFYSVPRYFRQKKVKLCAAGYQPLTSQTPSCLAYITHHTPAEFCRSLNSCHIILASTKPARQAGDLGKAKITRTGPRCVLFWVLCKDCECQIYSLCCWGFFDNPGSSSQVNLSLLGLMPSRQQGIGYSSRIMVKKRVFTKLWLATGASLHCFCVFVPLRVWKLLD